MRTFFLTLFSLVCVMSYGKKITDEALKNLCREVNQAIMTAETAEAKQSAFDSQTARWSKDYDLNQLTAELVETLFEAGGVSLDVYLRGWLEPVLAGKAEKETVFSFLAWKYMKENDGFMHGTKETDMLIRFLSSSDLQSVLDAHPDYALEVMNALATMKDANWHTAGFPEAIVKMLRCNLSELAGMECVKAFNSIARVDEMTGDYRETIRKECISKYQQLEKSMDNARKQKICQEQIKYLEGPFACGKLVGGKAPQLHFLRMFKDMGDSVATVDVKNLDDLKGKVVMLDFWGTKCVPCIKSFPEIAELQKRYADKEVVIVGITSLQGYFVDTPNHKTIQCRNNPEKEIGCFPAFMKAMGINWNIGITEENVMNTDYGVLAIPHVTIIDKTGNVRFNAVNADNEGKIALIDQLLAE